MTKTTTVRRGTKKAAAVFANATRCTAYTLSNEFRGHACDAKYAKQAHDGGAKLREVAPGRYHVTVHSNCWYELRTGDAVTHEGRGGRSVAMTVPPPDCRDCGGTGRRFDVHADAFVDERCPYCDGVGR